MKKKILFSLFIIIFIIVGCGKNSLKANTSLGEINYYVPENFSSHQELIGLLYNDDTRKIFINDDQIYIDVIKNSTSISLEEYVNNINKNLTEKDVLYKKVKEIIINKELISVFGRENYLINGSLNYAYFISCNGYIYTISIHGPKDKSDDITNISSDVLASLYFDN